MRPAGAHYIRQKISLFDSKGHGPFLFFEKRAMFFGGTHAAYQIFSPPLLVVRYPDPLPSPVTVSPHPSVFPMSGTGWRWLIVCRGTNKYRGRGRKTNHDLGAMMGVMGMMVPCWRRWHKTTKTQEECEDHNHQAFLFHFCYLLSNIFYLKILFTLCFVIPIKQLPCQ